ncbi:hypothetical protein POTOM_026801 [Populus tomentosa]|uniref:Uncharacterized protein n=1 Tax=Populus tomentosa TaxID=118781 RepID=A0A8X7ZEL1_POPTO|nr:hypothetical protein POTOM_026801 [Populus tomentosa]
MLRALSTCRNHGGYERLVEEPVNISLLDGKLKRAKSVPASVFGSSKSRKLGPELALQNISPAKPSSRKVSKSHPLFSLFNNRRKKKPTARPEFARYQRRIDSSEQSVVNPPPADHVEKSIVDFSLKIMQKP